MNKHRLETLTEAFWAGKTTQEEEQELMQAARDGLAGPELKAYVDFLQTEQTEEELGADFDAQIMRQLQQPVKKRRLWPQLSKLAAGLALILALGGGLYHQSTLQPPTPVVTTISEDTFADQLVAYEEVRKALYLLSSNLNEGLAHTQMLEELYKAQQTQEN